MCEIIVMCFIWFRNWYVSVVVMKIIVKVFVFVIFVVVFGFGIFVFYVQIFVQKVGFVNVDVFFVVYFGNKDVVVLSDSFNKDVILIDMVNKLCVIDVKGVSVMVVEKQQCEVLFVIYNVKIKFLNDKIVQVEIVIDKLLSDYVKVNGFLVIMDCFIVQQSGLVIYVDNSIDLIEVVKKIIK